MNLKKENKLAIFSILMFTILMACGLQMGFEKWPDYTEVAISGTCSVLFPAVLILLTNILPQEIKHKLVFMRLTHELPASRCNKLVKNDARIDHVEASLRWPEIFNSHTSPSRRNALWYDTIYKSNMPTNIFYYTEISRPPCLL